MNQSADAPGSPVAPLRSALTARVILLAPPLIILNAWWITEIEYVRYSDNATTQAIFFNAVTLLLGLLGLNALLSRIRRKWAFSTQELVALYVTVAVASNLAGHDVLQVLFTTLTYVFRHATPETGWATKIIPSLPAHLVVSDREAIDALYIGSSTLYRWDHIRPWLAPLGWWTLFAMLLVLTMVSLTALFRRQWDAERLNYPIAEIPVQVITQTGTLFRSRLLWGGIAVGAPVHPPVEKSRSAARERMRADLAAAIVRLKDDLVARCGLGENDLPHSPRERMAEA